MERPPSSAFSTAVTLPHLKSARAAHEKGVFPAKRRSELLFFATRMMAAAQNRRRFPLPFAISAAIIAVLRRHALARRMSALFLVVHVLHCLLYSGPRTPKLEGTCLELSRMRGELERSA